MNHSNNQITDYAKNIAEESYRWYQSHAIRARRLDKLGEVMLMLIASAIPASVIIAPGLPKVTALLGTAVVVVAGLKSIFHWHENYLRYSEAREAVGAEQRAYQVHSKPYDEGDRDRKLVESITTIESKEMQGWLRILAPHRSSSNDQDPTS